MKGMYVIRIGLLLVGLFVANGATTHHAATGRYDPDLVGVVEGEITEVFWRNPHVRMLLQRTADDGQEEEWEIEFGSVNTIERIGITRDLLAVGDRIGVYGRMGRNGLTAMFANRVIFSDGREMAFGASPSRSYGITEEALLEADNVDPSLRADIFRVWVPVGYGNRGAGNTGYPLTDAGRAVLDRWDPENDPALSCIPPGMPSAMLNPYPIEFEDRGDTIVLRLEEWDGERTLHMNGAGEPSQPRMGRSVGRWDGRTLIVETRDIADWRYIDDLGAPQSEDVLIDERFTLSEDGTDLSWTGRITDPLNYSEPVIMGHAWTWLPGHEIKPYNCELRPDR